MDGSERDRLCREIVDGIPDAVIFADREGVIRLWNAGAERIFGYTAGEAVGRSLDLIIPEPMRQRHWDGYFRVIETGVTRYGTELLAVPGVRKDGARVSLEFSIALLRDGAAAGGAAAILRDVTARWLKDKELRERIKALEAGSGGGAG
ncbi:MAG: PAS domain S-box protein [Gemmatimonadota bacterium]